jgi:hypothetical protein
MSSRILWAFLIGIVTLVWTTSSFAVVIGSGSGAGNSSSPSGPWGDLGWGYVGMVNGGSGIYLGTYGGANWVLTAGHVYNDGGNRNFSINGTTYQYVSGSGTNIAGLDLYVYQITVGSGTGLSLLANLSLASTSPVPGNPNSSGLSDPLSMVGYGRDRAITPAYWSVNTSNWTWTETNSASANAVGFQELSTRSKRWGYNYTDQVTTVNSTSMIQTTFRYSANDGTIFSTQAAVGDSGGGVFKLLDNGTYELAGVMDLVTTLPNQPANTAILNNSLTYSIDIATYRSAILDAVPEPGEFWLLILGGGFLGWVLFRAKAQASSSDAAARINAMKW